MSLPVLVFSNAAERVLPDALGGAVVQRVGSWPAFVQAAEAGEHRAYVVEAGPAGAPAVHGWLASFGRRAPVLVVAPVDQAESFLRAGAADVCSPGLDAEQWTVALRRIDARAEALERSAFDEERYRLMVEHTLDIVSVVDGLGRFTYLSPSVRDRLEWEPEELVGRSAFDIVHEDDLERVADVFWEAIMQPGTARALEYRIAAKDGSYRYLEGVGRALIGPDGEPYGVINARDITERNAAEEALRRSEARYRSLLEALPDAILRIAPDDRITDFHAPSNFPTAYGADDLRGRMLSEHVEPAIAHRFDAAVTHVRQEGKSYHFKYRLRIDGTERHRDVTCVTHGEEVLAVIRDTTDQVRAEAALREREALVREVVTRVPVVLFAFDPEGRITLAEGRGLEIIGMDRGGLVGTSILELYSDVPDVRRVAERALQGDTLSEVIEVDGRAFDTWVSALRGDTGDLQGAIGIAVDVTDMRRQQAELERSRSELRELAAHLQNVREAERARISREVHDVLGQSLTVIRLGVGWLGRRLEADEEARARVADTQERIDETVRHVRQIAAELRPGLLDDLGLASALEWQAQEFARHSGLACDLSCEGPEETLPKPIATAVFRIFQETLTNVARHAQASRVEAVLRWEAPLLTLVVSDDGVGISPERLAQRRTLGLLGMRERARMLGGEVHIVGQPGSGTTVRVEMPVQESVPLEATSPPAA